MSRFVRIVLLVCFFVFSKQNFSQDIRGAYVSYKWLSGYTYSITIDLLIDSTININRPSVYLFGSASTFTLNTTSAAGKIIVKKYSGNLTYSGPGFNTEAINESFRIVGIKNIFNSQNQFIYTESDLNITSFLGPNSSPIITNYPNNLNLSGNQILYNPAFYDSDGDSLSYSLISCSATPTLNYYQPNGAILNNFGILSFSKDSIGSYAFAYEIKQWRKDITLNYVMIAITKYDFIIDIAAGVGIKEFDKKETIRAYPNPVSNTLNIKSNSKTNSEIEIINCLGQTVLKQNYSESIDVSKLESGYYILKISGEKNYYSKFIKE